MQDHLELLEEREVSELLKISVPTLRRWRLHGEGPRFRKIGKRLVRYSREDIERWILAHTSVQSTTQARAAQRARAPKRQQSTRA
jgi:predicted DNA-binding transcriptional regulator AlpA